MGDVNAYNLKLFSNIKDIEVETSSSCILTNETKWTYGWIHWTDKWDCYCLPKAFVIILFWRISGWVYNALWNSSIGYWIRNIWFGWQLYHLEFLLSTTIYFFVCFLWCLLFLLYFLDSNVQRYFDLYNYIDFTQCKSMPIVNTFHAELKKLSVDCRNVLQASFSCLSCAVKRQM